MTGAWRLWVVAAVVLLQWCGGESGPGAEAGRVLGVFYFPGRSHYVVIEKLLKELAARGHQVDVVSHFPQEKQLPNFRDISLKGSWQSMVNAWSVDDLLGFHFFKLVHYMWGDNVEMCQKAMEHPALKELAQSKEHYDVVLVEIFGVDCAYGYAHKFGAPVIGLTTLINQPWAHARVGNPDNPAYMPITYTPFTSHMTFWQRTVNTAAQLYCKLGEKMLGQWSTDKMVQEHLGPTVPPLSDLLLNTSLVMVNSHFSLNGARPTVPGYVEIGGMHIDTTPEELPDKLKAFVDGAGPEGVVLLSFGSLLPAETLPAPKLQAIVQVLQALPQRVVWRVDPTRVPGGVPPNVYGSKWIPQQALLSHPKMRAFVTHGGIGGTQETVYWGVPSVVVPFFSDQNMNGNILSNFGAGRVLQYSDLTAETLSEALNAVLNDPRYQERAKELSRRFRDRPQPPLETAVFWTEYVMRHRGAPHLRSAAVQLAWYQEVLLDVVAALVVGAALLGAALWLATRAVWRFVCGSARGDGKARKAKKAKTS